MTIPPSWSDTANGGPDAAGDRQSTSQRCRVLIVDDNPDDRSNMRQMLLLGSERRYVFTEAENGASAVELFRAAQRDADAACPFDCLLLDFHLPDMSALDVLKALCGNNTVPPCPTVVITGWDGVSREDGAKLLRAGAQDYIGKSWTSADSLSRSLDNSIERFELSTKRSVAEAALRESEERYRTLVDSLNECLYVVERIDGASDEPVDFRYVSFNPAFLAQSDIRGEIGQTVRHLLPDESEEWFSACDRVCSTGVPIRFERTVPNVDRVLELFAFRLGGAGSRRVAIIFFDITARKQAELQLRSQADALADADRRKDEFLAMLGHELRNPLAPMLSAVEILNLPPSAEPRHTQALQIIERQVRQMTRLVDDLLDVSRFTTGMFQLRLERCTIRQIVERAVATTGLLVLQRAHSLTVTLTARELYLHADAARLEQVVVNLLNNAVKYTDAGGGIWLTVEEENDMAMVRVRDTGIGIAPELLPRIFDLFSQAEQSLDRSEGGLGVGLCLVRRLVEQHQGSIEVFSTVGIGSEFVVRLPMVAEPDALSPLPVVPTSVSRRTERSIRILIVDDNVDAAESLGMVLQAAGEDVWLAHDGVTALTMALEHPPQVVLLDIGLPLLDGYEVAKRLRQQVGLSGVVIVAITGYGQARDRDLSTNAGFDHHLLKPVDMTLMQTILATVVQ
ncbi:MAG: response regulator [Gemmatimonadaceae bacterium]|nr:response regulator [Gemmatimonadaceae bacterium]